ncbi:MAG: neutral/alkaline non-lysosomal ceramidase N-terminal domain-containing protein [Oceanococcus sp.]
MLIVRTPLVGIFLVAFLAGCSQNDTSGGRVQGIGEFHDTAVQGLDYEGTLRQGITGPNGEFEYAASDPIVFRIGDVELGRAAPKAYLTPLDMVGGADLSQAGPAPINMARLLLTLDQDCRPSNGIQLAAATRSAGRERSVFFAQSGSGFSSDPAVQAFLLAVDQAGGRRCSQLVSFNAAQEHLARTIEHMAREGRPNAGPNAVANGPRVVDGGDAVELRGQGSDSDGQISYFWEQISGPIVNISSAGTANADFIAPSLPAATSLVFQLTVTDDDGATDESQISIRINSVSATDPGENPGGTPQPDTTPAPINTAPQARDDQFSGPEDQAIEGQLRAADAEGDSLVFELVGDFPASGALNLNDNGFFRFVPSRHFNGQQSFQFRASDGALNSNIATVVLTLTAVNDAPLADAGSAQSVRSQDVVNLTGSGSDIEGDVSFAWTQLSGPVVSLQNQDQAAARFNAPDVGAVTELVFQLTVSDAEQAQASDTTSVVVSPLNAENLPPAANAGSNQSVEEGAVVKLDGSGSQDPDGQISAYNWIQVDNGASAVALSGADQAQAEFSAPVVTATTVFRFRLRVTDNDGETGDDQVDVTVTSNNLAPIADAGPDRTRSEGELVILDGSNSSDSDGNIAAYAWEQASGPAVTLDDSAIAQPRFTAPGVDSIGALLRFRLTVTDNENASDVDEVVVLVTDRPAGVFRVGAAKRRVTPDQRHIDGVPEERVGTAPHVQQFNLGGFGIDPLQNFPDPIGAFGGELTAPAEQRVHVNAQAVEEHTWVRAFALSLADETGIEQTIVFLSLDAVGAGNVIQKNLKAAVAAQTGLNPDNILFGQTHSHAGADLQGLWGGVPQDWIEGILYQQAVAAVDAALALRAPAVLSVNQQINNDYNNYRRPRLDADADADGHVTALQARAPDTGALLGHVLQYAAHPTSINESPRVPHADYILGAMDWLEQQGGVALYFNGPIADASGSGSRAGCTVSADPNHRPYEGVRCRGEGIAQASDISSKLSLNSLDTGLKIEHVEVTLPVTNPLFVAAGTLGSFNRYYDFLGLPTEQIPGIGPLAQEQLINLPQITPTATTLVSRIQIGGENGLEIVTIPGETTNTFGQYIRDLSPNKPMMLLGLTQNSFGYILPEEEFSYIDSGGDDGLVLPFTGYEEFVSLGPLTAPLLKLEGYNQLFDVAAGDVPNYLAACMQDPRHADCILNIQGQRLELTQRFFAEQCLDFAGEGNEQADAFCSLLNPDTPLRPICLALGFAEGVCGLLGEGGEEASSPAADLIEQELQAALRGCDPLDTAHCLYPFPSDHFTTQAVDGSVQSEARGGSGRRVNFNPLAMPRNSAGKPVDPSEWNRNDGFSPGQMIATYVDGLDLAATWNLPAAQIGVANPALSMQENAPIAVLEIQSDGSTIPHPVWAEIDANADLLFPDACREGGGQVDGDAADEFCGQAGLGDVARPQVGRAALLIRPAKNFKEGRRYIVVLRNLKNAGGYALSAGPVFANCTSATPAGAPNIDARCEALRSNVLNVLPGQIDRSSIYLAWDFTVASTQNNIARLKHMRDVAGLGQACPQNGQCSAPSFSIDEVLEPGEGNIEQGMQRQIHGTLTLPSFVTPSDSRPLDDPQIQSVLTQMQAQFPEEFDALFDPLDEGGGIAASGSVPPNRLYFSPLDAPDPSTGFDPLNPDGARYGDGLPDVLGSINVPFICTIPSQASAAEPARAGIYGHGLLDQRGAIRYDGVDDMSREHNYVFCAVDLFGFSQGDIPNVASTLVDLSNFGVVPDASQQGLLHYLALARSLRSANGFASHPAFQDAQGRSLFDNREIFYDGNSQGGIVGGVVLAASPDISRGSLGSLGMNYSTLLRRSVDFTLYSIPLYTAYTDELDRNLLFGMMQMLWDRSENNGYAHHITDNSAFGGPDNVAKLDPQFGDHQVTMWSADVMARTMGVPWDGSQVQRAAAELSQSKRHPDVQPGWGMPILDYNNPQHASAGALVLFDMEKGGEFADIPPIGNIPPKTGRDPHDNDAKDVRGRCHKAHFLRTGGQNIQTIPQLFDDVVCPAVPPVNTGPLPPDDDQDGVPNDADVCPGTPANTPVDGNGCAQVDPGDGEQSLEDLIGQLPDDLAFAAQRIAEGDLEGALNAVQAGGTEFADHELALLAQQVGLAMGLRLNPPQDKPAPTAHTPAPLQAGVGRGAIWVPIGTPLGGYLRPPVGGDYFPGAERFAEGDPSVFFAEMLDFLPTDQDHDGAPIAPVPDELRALHSPYATWSPPSRGVYDSLVAKSVALYDGQDYVVMVKTDFIGMIDEIVQAVRQRVLQREGIDLGEGLIMSGNHSHDGPGALANHAIRYFWLAMDVYQPALVDGMVDQLADVVIASLDDLQPAVISHSNALDTRNLNGYRRGRLEQYDEARMDAEVRKRIGVLRIDTADQFDSQADPLAVIINWSAHGIAFDVENLFFSGDMLGSVERQVEQSYNSDVMAMLVQSAGGDISPRGVGIDNKLQRIEAYGKRMAPQVVSLAANTDNPQFAPDLRVVSQRIRLSREDLGYAQDEFPFPWGGAQCNNEAATPFVDVFNTGQSIESCIPGTPPDLIDLLDNGVGENGAFLPQDTILSAAKIGDLLILPQPGEATTAYGLMLLDRIRDLGYLSANTFLWGTSQDHTGYILAPFEEDWLKGGTEGTTTFWGWKVGARFIDGFEQLALSLRNSAAAPRDEFVANYALYQQIYDQVLPPPATSSLLPGRILRQPSAQIQRFEAVRFSWEGGDPVIDAPKLVLQFDNGAGFVPARRRNGQIIDDFFEMHLDYELSSLQHVWSVDFEAPKDWPAGAYRFVVQGTAMQAAESDYQATSDSFLVNPADNLQLGQPSVQGSIAQLEVAYVPQPDNYRVVDAQLEDESQPQPVRSARVRITDSNGVVAENAASAIAAVGISPNGAVYRVDLPAGFGPIAKVNVSDDWGNTGLRGGGQSTDPLEDVDYGGGLIGLLAQSTADANPVLTALLDSNPQTAAQHGEEAMNNLADGFAEGTGNFDPTRPGETGIGTDVPLDEAAQRALSAARDSAPVVLTGKQLSGWSVPPAHGVAYPYPSGAIQTGALLDFFELGQVRNAHNGEILYPVAGSPGASGLIAVEQIAAYHYDAASDQFLPIPVQVDERAPYFLANAGSDFSVYSGTDPELTYVWDNGDDSHSWGDESWMMVAGQCEKAYPSGLGPLPDPVAGLDDDDEIVFMASDAGDIYSGTSFPAHWQAVQAVNVVDPLAPQEQRVVYLAIHAGGSPFNANNGYISYQRGYSQDGVSYNADQWIDRSFYAASDPEKLGTSNTGYGANLSGTVCPDGSAASAQVSTDRFPRDGVTVSTETYRFKASGRWMLRDLRIRPEDSSINDPSQWEARPDLVDRWKGRAFQQSPDSVVSLVGFEDEQVNWEANSALIGERCGAVRCLREVWGADSGTNVTKTESYYRDAISYQYRVRVHPIPADGLYTSWDYNRSAMVPEAGENVAGGRYFTMLRPQGVPIDGRNDELGNVDGYAPIPLAECIGSDGPQPPASSGRCPAFFDAADPTFNVPLAFDNWEQVAGKGDSGSLVYSFELVGLTSLANPLVVPYYRDDACLDDGTGDDPVQRPWPGESYDWNNGTVRQAYDDAAGRALDFSGQSFSDCLQRQGAHASHGIHYFVTHDSDNAFTPFSTTEIDARQWQYVVPTSTPKNIGEPYANNIRVPLQVIATPLSLPPVGAPPVAPGDGLTASCSVPPPTNFSQLKGSIHEHSGYSDGTLATTPADYYAAGVANGMDFMIGTDHSDNAKLPVTASQDCASQQFADCFQASPEGLQKWQSTAQMADAATNNSFTAVRGFEWTSDRFGHINVLFSSNDINAKTGSGYAVLMDDFWTWMGLSAETGGGDDAIAIFNHPGREDTLHSACESFGPLDESCGNAYNGDPAYAFNDFAYQAESDYRVVGVEMYGKSGDYYDGDNGAPPGGWYAHALDKGWHLGPVGAEDEHGREWAKSKRAKTVVLAAGRSRADLKNALLARRFYALAHDYPDVQLQLSAQVAGEGQTWPMGSRLARPAGSAITLSVAVSGLTSPRIEVVAPGGLISHAANAANLSFQAQGLSSQERYHFVRVIDTVDEDGDGKTQEVVAVSAPIWFRTGNAYPACPADPNPPAEAN